MAVWPDTASSQEVVRRQEQFRPTAVGLTNVSDIDETQDVFRCRVTGLGRAGFGAIHGLGMDCPAVNNHRIGLAGLEYASLSSIVHGQRFITAETALLLGRFFGNSARFWMGLQVRFAPCGGG